MYERKWKRSCSSGNAARFPSKRSKLPCLFSTANLCIWLTTVPALLHAMVASAAQRGLLAPVVAYLEAKGRRQREKDIEDKRWVVAVRATASAGSVKSCSQCYPAVTRCRHCPDQRLLVKNRPTVIAWQWISAFIRLVARDDHAMPRPAPALERKTT